MLINQARNLASLPYSSLQQLQQSIEQTQQLLGAGAAHRLRRPADRSSLLDAAMRSGRSQRIRPGSLIADARARWQNSVGGFQDALRVQAGVVGNLDDTRDADVGRSSARARRATGALQATQAGNQLLALQTQQLADLTALSPRRAGRRASKRRSAPPPQDQGREQTAPLPRRPGQAISPQRRADVPLTERA